MTEKLYAGLEKLGLNFTKDQTDKLETYIAAVMEFNKTYNLMKADSPDDLAVNHVLDSLCAVPHIQNLVDDLSKTIPASELKLADIGSGGGCPGIPLCVAFPELNFTLVERMEKRCAFLESAIRKMGLKNVRVLCLQADKVEKESFHIEVFRAFHPFDNKITKLLLGMLKKGGYIAAYKARAEKIQAEMEEIKMQVPEYKRIQLTVPFLEDHERNLVVIQK